MAFLCKLRVLLFLGAPRSRSPGVWPSTLVFCCINALGTRSPSASGAASDGSEAGVSGRAWMESACPALRLEMEGGPHEVEGAHTAGGQGKPRGPRRKGRP